MFKSINGILRSLAATFIVASAVFSALYLFSKRDFFFGSDRMSELAPEPLGYESVGNLPPLEESKEQSIQETEYTLELGTCSDKPCIEKTLATFKQKGVDAFYTPFKINDKVIFRIRRGIFSSRLSAERAKLALGTEKQIKSEVSEL